MDSDTWSAVGTGVGAIAALGSLAAAIIAARIAADARKATQTLTDIEARREWRELTPTFELTLRAVTEEYADLRVELAGPTALGRLDEIKLTVRDDQHGRGASSIAGGPTDEQIRNHVWGAYRFRRGVDGGSDSGRSVAPFPLPIGEFTRKAMDQQVPPQWAKHLTKADWQRQYAGKPVRFLLDCRRDGFPPWRVPIEATLVPVPEETQST
ncbi:hypothetical protein [Actinoplanes auranticolor]|uniref:Uncharacterized protein n=1 Tax=Actinoplanes auranticolor TaxID=47988 RepID=A0A919VWZ7_9ACTN|nr:hypothetical protein [Actinoplanes auranticolor]GIM80096.1 hypothetical protein Aau02nite_88970 [Actinoplanes auranticolor]